MSRATVASTGSSSRRRPADSEAKPRAAGHASGYFARSELPFTSLVFVLPLIAFYELGTRHFALDPTVHAADHRIVAFRLLQTFFTWCRAPGQFMPALAVVVILLACHVARRESWSISAKHLLGMALESASLSIPLIILGLVVARYAPLMAVHRITNLAVLSVGAGIYEELVFRLFAFTVLSFLLVDLLELRVGLANLLMVLISSLLFSLYHYLGTETFHIQTFAFRTLAGVYFGAVFAFRGFGITAGSHAAYDIIVTLLQSVG